MTKEKPIANTSVVLREEFDDWAVLFDPETGNAFSLNPTSVLIWKLLDGKHTRQDILEKVKIECDDAPLDTLKDIEGFIQSLEKQGMVGYETS